MNDIKWYWYVFLAVKLATGIAGFYFFVQFFKRIGKSIAEYYEESRSDREH